MMPRETIQDSASQDSASISSYPINNVNVNSESVSELSGVSDSITEWYKFWHDCTQSTYH